VYYLFSNPIKLPGAAVMALVLLAAVMGGADKAGALTYIETPSLAARVKAGELPPIAERLPSVPRVIAMDGEKLVAGRHGGRWRMLIHRSKDVKMFSVYGYARLVTYSETLELVPDILAEVIVENERVYTLKLRQGHKWSDGHPFTSEDFRYYWEDVANHEELSPAGPPRALRVNNEMPVVEILDETTIRYSWSQPNPTFLPALAGAAPLYIYRPAHYLKQFHADYKKTKKKKVSALSSRLMRNWAAEHNTKDNQYKFDNPDLPTLQPWINTTRPPATRFVGLRNPYFHRVDPNGRQLPYFDEVTMTVADSKLIPAKVGSGEVDLQARNLNFSDYTFLKEGEDRHSYTVRLWRTAGGARLALFPNLNVKDEEWRALFRDVRFRRALSLAINRHEINQVMYYGLGVEGNNTVLADSPLFKPRYRDRWARYDVDAANQLLDQIGLTSFDDDDFRLMEDGRRLEIIVETAGEDTEQSDVLELVRDAWAEIGIKVYTKPSQREVFRNRIYAGESQMSIWAGYENAIPTANMSPGEFAPTRQTSLQWPKWGQHYETSGMAGVAPELPAAARLLELHEEWFRVGNGPERERIWHEILDLHAENVFTIGLISGVLQPVVVADNLRNVPQEGIYNWNPGAHLGIYMPDTFWFDN
ncbi:MAG: ABC transporter substrate-binding protein, partial [Alphaproteobacteria bacterium]